MQKNSCCAREWHGSLEILPGSYIEERLERGVGGHAEARPRSYILKAFFPTAALAPGEVLHFLLVDLDLARLFHLLAKVGQEHSEKILLLCPQKSIANLILLRGKVLIGRILLLQNRQHNPVIPGRDGSADFAGLHGKRDR